MFWSSHWQPTWQWKTLESKRGIHNIVKTKVSFKACIYVGHIFTIPTSGNILMFLHRLLFHTTSYSDLHYWSYCNHFISSKSTQFSSNVSIVSILQNCEMQQADKTNWKKRKTKCGTCLGHFPHGVAHLHERAVSIVCCTVRTFFSTVPFTAFRYTECFHPFSIVLRCTNNHHHPSIQRSIMYNTYIVSWCIITCCLWQWLLYNAHNKYRYTVHLLHSRCCVNSKKTTLSIAPLLTVMLYLPTSSSVKSRNMMVLLTMLTLSMSDISWPSSLTKDAIQGTGLPLIFTVIVMFWPTCSCVLGGLGSGASNPTQRNTKIGCNHDQWISAIHQHIS